jgi:hypothetical protein
MTEIPLTDALKQVLKQREVKEWLLGALRGGVAPAWREGKLVLRFDRDEEAAEFSERWLGGQPSQ